MPGVSSRPSSVSSRCRLCMWFPTILGGLSSQQSDFAISLVLNRVILSRASICCCNSVERDESRITPYKRRVCARKGKALTRILVDDRGDMYVTPQLAGLGTLSGPSVCGNVHTCSAGEGCPTFFSYRYPDVDRRGERNSEREKCIL